VEEIENTAKTVKIVDQEAKEVDITAEIEEALLKDLLEPPQRTLLKMEASPQTRK